MCSATTPISASEARIIDVSISGTTNITTGGTLSLACLPGNVEERIEVAWMFKPSKTKPEGLDIQNLGQSGRETIAQAKRMIYTKENVSVRDSGDYSCIITTETGTAEASITVLVHPSDSKQANDQTMDTVTVNPLVIGILLGVLGLLIIVVIVGVVCLLHKSNHMSLSESASDTRFGGYM